LKTNINKNTILKDKIRKKKQIKDKKKRPKEISPGAQAKQAHMSEPCLFCFSFLKGRKTFVGKKKKQHQVAHCILT
jgi:hypothetical protein